MIRAKFEVTTKLEKVDGFEVELIPVSTGSKENEKFYKYTPYGKLSLGLVSGDTADMLEVGKEYYIDISEAKED